MSIDLSNELSFQVMVEATSGEVMLTWLPIVSRLLIAGLRGWRQVGRWPVPSPSAVVIASLPSRTLFRGLTVHCLRIYGNIDLPAR